jgi:alpha-L-fucosidase
MQGIRKLGKVQDYLAEVTPFVYCGELLMFESVISETPDNARNGVFYLRIRRFPDNSRDVTGADEFQAMEVLTEFAEGFTFGVPFVCNDSVYVYATRYEKPDVDDVHVFVSSDLKTWTEHVAVRGENERVYNTSVCHDAANDRFIMAIETNDKRWHAFTIRFAESTDLIHWRKLPESEGLYGTDRYTACPAIRWMDGYFYMMCLEMPRRTRTLAEGPGSEGWWFEEFGARSRDLVTWEMAPANPIIAPEPDGSENINTSDIDFCGLDDRTIIYYTCGNQTGEHFLAHAVFDGPEDAFLRSWFD